MTRFSWCLLVALPMAFLGCREPDRRPTVARAPSVLAEAEPPPTSQDEPSPAASVTSAPSPPTVDAPYDLSADLRRRREEALAALGKGAKTEIVEQVFVLAAPAGFDLTGSADLVKRALAAYFHDRFAKRPSRALTVFLFPSAPSYDSFCQRRFKEACMSPYGFFHPEPRFIVMNAGPGLGTLTHELVHPIVETDFPTAPTWLDEGIASLFEAPVLPRAREVHGVKNWRHPRLLAGLASKKDRSRVSLPSLFSLSNEAFRGEGEDLHYVLARTFCLWLDNRGQLFPFYQRFRDGHAEDPTGARAFEAVTKLTPEQANAEFLLFARGL